MKSVYFNSKVYVEKNMYAEAVLVEDGRITLVGTNADVIAASGTDCEKIDCQGNTMIPGLNDSHLHLLLLALQMNEVQIGNVTSISELISVCKDFIQAHPDRTVNGIHAIGWNQDLFSDEKRLPDRHDLDQISTEIPIVLERVCGHMLAANTKVIESLRLTANSPQIPGGEFRIGDDGYPNGIFAEKACDLAKSVIPEATYQVRRNALLHVMEYLAAHGVTSVQSNDVGHPWCGSIEEGFGLFRDVYAAGEGCIRYHHQLSFQTPELFEEYLSSGEFSRGGHALDSMLTQGPLKLFKDGSLGAKTALMKNGYAGDNENHGIDCTPSETMERYCQLAKKYGVQVITHVIGDRAASEVIDCYEKAFVDGKNKLRHSLVHCQITDQEILDRITTKGILVQAQPVFIDYDMTILESHCGKGLAETSYNFGTLLNRGVHLSYGTDSPVENCNPFVNIYMAVTRKNRAGQPDGGFYPKECVDVETAIDAYTYESAYNEFKEDIKGRIKPGYLADLVVLDRDIFTCDPMEIKDILPVMTVVGGKIVYKK